MKNIADVYVIFSFFIVKVWSETCLKLVADSGSSMISGFPTYFIMNPYLCHVSCA